MKQILIALSLMAGSCQKPERFVKESTAFPKNLTGRWECIYPSGNYVFQARLTVVTSGDSLLWKYYSQTINTKTNRKLPCVPETSFWPVAWDDSLHLVRANHGVGQGSGYDYLRLISANQLQINSLSLASYCRENYGGMNATQLIFSKVDSFHYEP